MRGSYTKMSTKIIKIIGVLYFVFMGIMALFVLELVEFPETISEVPIIKNIVGPRLPTEKDLKNLEEAILEVNLYLEENELPKDEIEQIYAEVETSPVCSIANRNFNSLAEHYEEYMEKLADIRKCIEKLEKKYKKYITLLENIPEYSRALREEKYGEFEEVIEPLYADIISQKETYDVDQEEVEAMYQAAKKIADDFFEEYYYWMVHIVNAEAGYLNYSSVAHLYSKEEIEAMKSMERCYVANVIENRIMDPAFPNNIYDVIFAPNQYAPTKSGSIYLEPYPQTCIDVENYLRGRVETGMPRSVVYQALFTQGSRKATPWMTSPSGHFFCYK